MSSIDNDLDSSSFPLGARKNKRAILFNIALLFSELCASSERENNLEYRQLAIDGTPYLIIKLYELKSHTLRAC